MAYNRQKDRHDVFIRSQYRKHNPRSKLESLGWIALWSVVGIGLAVCVLAGDSGL